VTKFWEQEQSIDDLRSWIDEWCLQSSIHNGKSSILKAMQLRPRQKVLLAAVIERYVQSAEPVGSSALAHDAQVAAMCGQLSSATIRNELAELEELGLLAHPHTSAGRIPTDAGYRIYVNEMMKPRPLNASEKERLETWIPAPPGSLQDALRDATMALAKLTGYPALASMPAARQDTMRHVQINPIPPHRLILVLVTGAGRIDHRMFDVEGGVPQHRLQTVVNFLNDNLGGRRLGALRSLSFEDVSAGLHEAETLGLARRAWEMVRQSVADVGDEKIVVQGLITLLNEPEFSEIGQARAAMQLFDDQSALSDLLSASLPADAPTPHTVVIGHELSSGNNPAVERFSLVGVAYGTGGEVLGTVGVLGPTRMKYADAISLMPALAARLRFCLETL
jgi:heat-inducible transcriptional repressor